jgi:hypothetical protein
MANFKYLSKKVMQPRPSTNYRTTYYSFSIIDQRKLQAWVEDVCIQAMGIAQEENQEQSLYERLPNPKHKHLNGQHYTIWEALTDLRDQLRSGKDLPEAMVNRWNDCFQENMDIQINLVPIW